MDILNNANTIVSLILAIFGIGGYAVAIVGYLRGKATVNQKSSSATPQKSSNYSSWLNVSSRLSWLDWMEAIAAGSKDFIILADDNADGPNDCMIVPLISGVIALGALWFFALIFWTFGIVDNWRPAWFVAALVFSTIVLATLVYFIGRRVEEKAMMIQGN